MDNKVIPNVPIMVNTYYPPNAPTAKRSYKFGQALRKAIESWDATKRVAIIASGGLSHTVIEEDLDQRIIDGLKHNDVEKLTDYPDVRFRGGDVGTQELDHPFRRDGRRRPADEHGRLCSLLPDRGRQRLRDGLRGVEVGVRIGYEPDPEKS